MSEDDDDGVEVLGRLGRSLRFASRGRALAPIGFACAAAMAGASWILYGEDGDRGIAAFLAGFAAFCALGSAAGLGGGDSLAVDADARVLRLGDGGVVDFSEIGSVSAVEAEDGGGLFESERCAELRLRGGRSFRLGVGRLGFSTWARARALAAELSAATGAPVVDGKPEKI